MRTCTLEAVVSTEWIRTFSLSTPICTVMPWYYWLPFFVWCISGSRSCFSFLVELGAAMMMASLIVPCFITIPLALRFFPHRFENLSAQIVLLQQMPK